MFLVFRLASRLAVYFLGVLEPRAEPATLLKLVF